MTSAPGLVCLYFGDPCECQNCGGCVTAEGGPFPGDPRYCSEDCFAEAQARRAVAEARDATCGRCGFDRGEHQPGCPAIPEGYCPGGGAWIIGVSGPARAACRTCGASWLAASLGSEGTPAHRPHGEGS